MTMDSVGCNSCNIGSLDEHFKDEFSVETREILSLFEVLIGEKRGIIDSFFKMNVNYKGSLLEMTIEAFITVDFGVS